MPTTPSKVGLSDGANYTSLTAWEHAVDGSGGTQIAELTTDITDNLQLYTWPSSDITIRSDKPGVKRTVFSAHNGNHMIHAGDPDIGSLTIEDIILDGAGDGSSGNTGQNSSGAGKSGIMTTLGTGTLTLNRVHIKNVTQHSVLIWSNSKTEVLNCDNCIFENPPGSAYRGALATYVDADATVATFRNCLFVGCGGAAQNCVADSDNIGNYFNCLSFGNTGADFAHAGGTQTTNVLYCVSQDSTAANANHDDNTGSVGLDIATVPDTYFTDYTNDDYTLKNDDYTNWGINGDSANTPAKDFNNRTRVNNDIGPFEYVQHMVAPAIDQTLTMKMARGLADHEH